MKHISNILYIFLLVSALIILIAFLIPQLFGVKVKAVISGSMEPYIPTGSVVYIASAEFSEINTGDDITYKTKNGVYVTHRVIKKDESEGTVQTMGTANNVADVPVYADSILGKVIFTVPTIGTALIFLSSTSGKIIAVTAVLAIAAAAFLLDKAAVL